VAPAGQALITDFTPAQGDLIDLSGIDANALPGGDQEFAFIGTAAFSGTPGELRDDAGGGTTLVSGDVNGDGTADFAIRLAGDHTLAAGNFVPSAPAGRRHPSRRGWNGREGQRIGSRPGGRLNYRHAFHAGNFADCVKHAVLVWLLRALARKPAGFAVLDTHAGIGRYDLSAGPAARTGEWRAGIGRLLGSAAPELADYLGLVRELGLYPGSPALARALLRPQDRLICCELHPEDAAALRRLFRGDAQVSVHRRDGWEALGALLPPPERRGIVLIDPPFEAPDEFARLAGGLARAQRRFAAGVKAAWYPVKGRAGAQGLAQSLKAAGIRDTVLVELHLREPLDAARLDGCGMLVVNPPFGFEAAMRPLLAALLAGLGSGEAGAGVRVERIADE
jgi:23S rRNA (adenine2030-N6)-methyltransferase